MKKEVLWKKGLVLTLSAAMISPFLPAAVSAADTDDVALLADFTFDDADSVTNGGNAKATVNGSYELKESKDAASGNALYLNGNASNYLSVTDADGKSLLAGKEEITISYDAKPDRTSTSWVFYSAPNTNAQKAPEYYIGAFANGGNTKVERYKNGRTIAITEKTGSDWAHVDIVYTKDTTTTYVNGMKKQSVSNSDAPLTDILGDNGIFYIGRANWGSGESYKGWIDNFKVYDGALTDKELVNEDAAKEAVAADKEALTLNDTVTADFTLPSKGNNGSTITWSVPDNAYAVIGEDGYKVAVTRPADEDAKVTFTATIQMGAVTETKEIEVTVRAELKDADVVADAVKKLEIVNSDDVRGNVTLPTEVEVDGTNKKASVTWESSNPEIVTDKAAGGKDAGVVTRQKKDTEVTMTATVTCGEASQTKEITLKVKAAAKQEEKTDYLFAYFVNNGGAAEQQIFFASSHDGNNWMDLNKKEAVLSVADSVRTPEDIEKTQNQAGVRDPYMVRSPEGDKFYLIATDLCIGSENISAGTVGWGTSQYNGSHCLRVWESTDLVNWSEPWLAEVAPKDTTCAWAPETIYDETTGQFVVYWASMTGSVQKVYYSYTRDFKNFSEPQMFIDNGNNHIIDTTMVKAQDGTYYRGSAASGTIKLEKCTDSSKWLTDQSVWESQGYIKDITGFTAGLEGPELFMYNEDDWKEVNGEKVPTYGLLADNFGSKGYIPFYTTDIANAKWVRVADNDYNFDTLHKRHGTVISLTADEYARVMEAYGPQSIAVKTAPSKTTYDAATDTAIDGTGLSLTVTYKNGKTETVTYNAGSKNARQFTFGGVDFAKNGKQTATVTYGEQTATFEVEVTGAKEAEELAIVTDPSDYKGIVGETAEFTVEATGEGLTYQWEYCNAGSDKWRTSSMEGSTEATIKVPVGTWRDGQKYRCVVKDEAGNTVTSKEAVMTVGKADTAPVITAQPESVTRNKGEIAEFTVKVTGENLTYQWEYCNAGSDKWRTSSMEGNQTETIKVAAGTWRNGQKYRCVVTGADGRIVVSEAAVLTVK